jgi:hypothetical protein
MRDADAITKLYDILMSLWQFDFASHYDHIVNGWLMYVFWWRSQSYEQISSQCTLNQYYPHLPSVRTVQNAALEWIGSV